MCGMQPRVVCLLQGKWGFPWDANFCFNLLVVVQHHRYVAYLKIFFLERFFGCRRYFVNPITFNWVCSWRILINWICSESAPKIASVKQMLQELDWPSLEQCRRTAQLGMLYKISSGLAAVKCPLLKKQPPRARRTHTTTFERIPSRADNRLNSFFPRTVRDWNTLPLEMVSCPFIGGFISRVAKLQ